MMLKIWRDKKGSKRSLWLGSSIQPIGVSVPYPNASRLEQEGSAINRLHLSGVSPVGRGQIRLDAGLVQQHLGGADSLYWSSLTPRHWTSDSIRLFDTSLGANAYYVFRSYYLEAGLGSPISNDTSPFETANGFRGQLVTGWALDDANILIGGRQTKAHEQRSMRRTSVGAFRFVCCPSTCRFTSVVRWAVSHSLTFTKTSSVRSTQTMKWDFDSRRLPFDFDTIG